MNKYKVIKGNVSRSGKIVPVGDVINLTDKQASALVNKVELVPEISPPKPPETTPKPPKVNR